MAADHPTSPPTIPPPLAGIRVIDFSRIIAGPLCTQQLADLGADVIKVEHPDGGDESRARSTRGDGRGAMFLAFNRSKRSIAIDLGLDEGRELARRLVRASDVVVENFRPGVMERLGLGSDQLRADHPELVYVSISAYGTTGPSADRPGLDPVLQAESGMMALSGPVDGGPTRHPLSIIDTLTAAHASSAIGAALRGREVHGQGDVIELSLFDTAVAALGNVGLQWLTDGQVPPRSGNRHVSFAPIGLFATASEPIYLAASTVRLFAQLCSTIDRADLLDDERFATPSARSRHRDALEVEIESVLVTRPAEEWLTAMAHLPVGAVRTVDQVLDGPEAEARGSVRTIPDGDEAIRVLASPFRSALTEPVVDRPPPRLAEHTDDVLRSVLGLSDDQVTGLRDRSVVR